MKKFLSPVDASFLFIEDHDSPAHVAGLQIFSLPQGAGPDFVTRLVERLRQTTDVSEPWNLRLGRGSISKLLAN
jgi:diacylglycerol O-acyltransferase / wax synthase